MTARLNGIPFLLLVIQLIAGCHVISDTSRRTVDPSVTFADIRTDPEAHRGRSLLLGGLIIGHRVEDEGSLLEIMRWRLDPWGEPIAVDENAGRFLLTSAELLDPVVYGPGRLVTLIGSVTGAQTHRLGQIDYRYPVLRLKEIHLWDTPFRYGIRRSPNIYVPHYVGPERPGRTSPYDPSYYTYPYTPYWLRSRAR